MFDRVTEWWRAPDPAPPFTAGEMAWHLSRHVARLLPAYLLVLGWQYASVGLPGAVLVLGSGLGLLTALAAGVLGALDRRYPAAAAFGVTAALLGRLGPFVDGLGAAAAYVRWASVVLIVATALTAVLGYAEVTRLREAAFEE